MSKVGYSLMSIDKRSRTRMLRQWMYKSARLQGPLINVIERTETVLEAKADADPGAYTLYTPVLYAMVVNTLLTVR